MNLHIVLCLAEATEYLDRAKNPLYHDKSYCMEMACLLVRRAFAEFVVDVREAYQGRAPFTPTPTLQADLAGPLYEEREVLLKAFNNILETFDLPEVQLAGNIDFQQRNMLTSSIKRRMDIVNGPVEGIVLGEPSQLFRVP